MRRLKRFRMMGRNSMATPMMKHLRNLCDEIDIFFVERTLCQYMVES
jgi:hypothetical protein